MSAFSVSDEFVEDLARIQPTLATNYGISTYDDRWDDLNPEGHAAVEDLLRSYRGRFEELPPSGDPWAQHALAIAFEYLDRRLSFYDGGEHWRNLNSMASPVQDLRQTFDVMDMDSAEGWEAIVARLDALPASMQGYVSTLEEGRGRGLTAARRQVRAAIRQCETNAGDESFFESLGESLAASGVEGMEQRVAQGVVSAREAFADLGDYLTSTYLPTAIDVDGVGRERYEMLAHRFTGTHLDFGETYDWGWDQVHSLREEASAVAAEVDADAHLREVMHVLKNDPAHAASSPAEFVEIMQERQDRAMAELSGTHFEIPEPIRRVTVNIAPKGGSLGAYYMSPTEDFSRPGSIWYSVGDQRVFPLYDEVSTAYHEGFPGHHLQVGYVMCLADELSRLARSFAWWSGSGEGWALYAEKLMYELGYFEKPDYVLGMLMNHLFRACRVVIDIGSHLGFPIPDHSPVRPGEPWSFDAGVEMLTDVAFIEPAVARSEVTRYLGWPGQAIAYKVGERVIRDLREEQRRRLGQGFDLKDFHTRVLSAGGVGLDLLRTFVLSTGAGS